MKRQTIFFSVALSAVLCAAMTGCAPGSSAENRAIEEAKNAKGIEVTEEEWNEAMAYFQRADAEYSTKFEFQAEREDENGQFYRRVWIQASVKGGKGHASTYAVEKLPEDDPKEVKGEMYAVTDANGDTFLYNQTSDGTWLKGSEFSMWEFSWVYGYFASPIPVYGEFVYRAEKNGYVPVSEYYAPFVYMFDRVGGAVRLVAWYSEIYKPDGYTDMQEGHVFSYSAPDILLPEVGEE